jgi:catechol 2,3-dioxygenase-like lactoylglutathione lyase family enzyme
VHHLRENETDGWHGWRHLTTGGAKGKRSGGFGRMSDRAGMPLIDYALMSQRIAHVALIVRDYDEAIEFFTGAMGFQLIEDAALGDGKRWVVVGPQGASGSSLLLARATTEQGSSVGNQSGGRVFLFLHTDEFWRDYRAMRAKGVKFNEEPREEIYGTVAVFEDLYGNKWDLLQPK